MRPYVTTTRSDAGPARTLAEQVGRLLFWQRPLSTQYWHEMMDIQADQHTPMVTKPLLWFIAFSMTLVCAGCAVIDNKEANDEPVSALPLADASSIQNIIRTLPSEYFANCPYADREQMLADLSTEDDGMLDGSNGWLDYFSDGGSVRCDSMIRLKTFRSPSRGIIVFVHMMRPYNGGKPSSEDSYVLALSIDQTWKDISDEVLPTGLVRDWHFNPRRSKNLIEAGPWVGNIPKRCVGELKWTGERFEFETVAARPFWDDISNEALWP